MKSSARHTLSNQQAQPKEAETVNLTENDAKSLSKTPCLVALNMYLTLHLLLFWYNRSWTYFWMSYGRCTMPGCCDHSWEVTGRVPGQRYPVNLPTN